MYCTSKDFSRIALAPPQGTIVAQLIRRTPHQGPQIVTAGYTIAYAIPGNTSSIGKTNFWAFAQNLFGLSRPLSQDAGLSGKGLTGTLDTSGTIFFAKWLPVTPYRDSNIVQEAPYQLIHLEARAQDSKEVIAATDVVIPVSNEVGCVQADCHSSEQGILKAHPIVSGLNAGGPVLCAQCHESSAAGRGGTVEAKSLSFRMHDIHANLRSPEAISTCYRCHPGPRSHGFRDVMRTGVQSPLDCQNCHGTLAVIAQSISNGRRPWLDEPRCGSALCHGSVHSEEVGKLYKDSRGHGGIMCAGCHGSPHAILPTAQANDNLQSIRLQGNAGPLRNCQACHISVPAGPGPHGLMPPRARMVNSQKPELNRLYQNSPNPFNPETDIQFDITVAHRTRLAVFDARGNEVEKLVDADLNAGTHGVTWNAAGYPSGVYYLHLQSGDFYATKRMRLSH